MKIVLLTLVQTPEWEGTVTLLHGTSVGHDPLGVRWGLCECGTLGAARSCVFRQSRWGHVRAVWAVGQSDGWEDWLRRGGGWRSPSWLGSVYQILDWTRAKKRIWKSGWGVRWVLDVVPAWQERVRVRQCSKELKGLAASRLVVEGLDLCCCVRSDSGDAAEVAAVDCSWCRPGLWQQTWEQRLAASQKTDFR